MVSFFLQDFSSCCGSGKRLTTLVELICGRWKLAGGGGRGNPGGGGGGPPFCPPGGRANGPGPPEPFCPGGGGGGGGPAWPGACAIVDNACKLKIFDKVMGIVDT